MNEQQTCIHVRGDNTLRRSLEGLTAIANTGSKNRDDHQNGHRVSLETILIKKETHAANLR